MTMLKLPIFGEIYKKVLRSIEKFDCDLVAMAFHQPNIVRESLVGPYAERVVRRSPVSDLVVRA